MSAREGFEGWAILELMGHRRLTGHVSEVEIAGSSFIRIDVPGDHCAHCGHLDDRHSTSGGMCAGESEGSECLCIHFPPLETSPAATQFYSPAAVYCITPTTEAIVRATRSTPRPVQEWEIRHAALNAGDERERFLHEVEPDDEQLADRVQ